MTQQQQWMSLLGLANRARKLISGEELVVKEIRSGNAKVVIAYPRTLQKTLKKISLISAHFIRFLLKRVESRSLLGHAIGKDARVAVAVSG